MKIWRLAIFGLIVITTLISCGDESPAISVADAEYIEIVSKQFLMNEESWAKLLESGVTKETKLRLDFYYTAESEKAVLSLLEFLKEETEYELGIDSTEQGKWILFGQVEPRRLGIGILNEWSDWMVKVGLDRKCKFDGWGTELP